MYITVGVIIILVLVFIYFKKSARTTVILGDDTNHKSNEIIEDFIKEIILDYYNEYRINFLAVRFDINELSVEKNYVFKTKRIGSLANILDYNQLQSGEKKLKELISTKYNIIVSINDQLSFITEISRIEGKIKALDSVKASLHLEDYLRLKNELEEDIAYYIKKYAA
ncbi:hypothetical protein [Lacinutrix undariae]